MNSLRARLFISEVAEGDVDPAALTRCQADARQGLYAGAMSGFLKWLAPRVDQLRQARRQEVEELRGRAAASAMHRRTPGTVANLAWGLRHFLRFAQDVGALSAAAAN